MAPRASGPGRRVPAMARPRSAARARAGPSERGIFVDRGERRSGACRGMSKESRSEVNAASCSPRPPPVLWSFCFFPGVHDIAKTIPARITPSGPDDRPQRRARPPSGNELPVPSPDRHGMAGRMVSPSGLRRPACRRRRPPHAGPGAGPGNLRSGGACAWPRHSPRRRWFRWRDRRNRNRARRALRSGRRARCG